MAPGKVGDSLRIEVLRMTGSLCLELGGGRARGETGSAETMAQFLNLSGICRESTGNAQGTVRKGRALGPEVSLGGC